MCTVSKKAPKGATKMANNVARAIRQDRQTIESLCTEFRARWAKVYPKEFSDEMERINKLLKDAPKDELLRREKWALEQVACKRKALRLTEDVTESIKGLHDFGLTFEKICLYWMEQGLQGTRFLNEDGVVCDKKKNKETGEFVFVPIEKWTEAKFMRMLRIASVDVAAEFKVSVR